MPWFLREGVNATIHQTVQDRERGQTILSEEEAQDDNLPGALSADLGRSFARWTFVRRENLNYQ